jgi:hypothetical protein
MRIQVLTHCDPRRAIRACILANSVPQYIEVLCAVNGDLESVLNRINPELTPANLRFLPAVPKEPYPANPLRNLALSKATADWVFYVDTDFVFCEKLWTSLPSNYRLLADTNAKICLCPVALWDPQASYLNELPLSNLIDIERLNSHVPPRTWSKAQRAGIWRDYKSWSRKSSDHKNSESYEITDRMRAFRNSSHPIAPFGLLRRKDIVPADEDFTAGAGTREQFVRTLLDAGVRFFALPDLFIFHLWHPSDFT